MHKVDALSFVGQPNEIVSLATQIAGGGQIAVTLDGQAVPATTTFPLPGSAGGHRTLQIALVGPIGASCVVGISTVDDGTDGDLLLVQAHSPAPVHFYTFAVAGPAAVNALAEIRRKKRGSRKGGSR